MRRTRGGGIAAATSLVWLGMVLWLNLPASMWLAGVSFAWLFAWRNERKRQAERAEPYEDYGDNYDEHERDGILWL